jgi:hypothetical protein
MKRRDFLQTSALAAVGAAALGSGVFRPEPAIAEAPAPANSWAAGLKNLNAHEGETLLKVTRQLYPHEKLPDALYVKVVQDLDAEAQSSPETAKLLHDGVAGLDGGSKKFIDMSPDEQLAALKAIESAGFFQKVRGAEIVSLYNNPEVWKQFGYQGSAYEFGGYLKHGFNDLKWLPDPPESASPKLPGATHKA